MIEKLDYNNTQYIQYTKEIYDEIDKKSFYVYDYISYDELFLTIQRDYLDILLKINIPLSILFVVFFIIDTLTPSIVFLPVLRISYGIIFLILFTKFIIRSYQYLTISSVILTKNKIILGKNIIGKYEYSPLFEKYEEEFDEQILEKSRLKTIIEEKRSMLEKDVKEMLTNLSKKNKKSRKDDFSNMIYVGFIIYVISIIVTYYIGYIFGIIIFGTISIFLKMILFLSKNIVLQIKNDTLDLDKSLNIMDSQVIIIDGKIKNFEQQNLSTFDEVIKRDFSIFYKNIEKSLKYKQRLLNTINKYKYKDLLNINLLELYIRDNFNKPILNMIKLLETESKKIDTGIANIKDTKSDNAELIANLGLKESVLINNKNLINYNINILRKSIL